MTLQEECISRIGAMGKIRGGTTTAIAIATATVVAIRIAAATA